MPGPPAKKAADAPLHYGCSKSVTAGLVNSSYSSIIMLAIPTSSDGFFNFLENSFLALKVAIFLYASPDQTRQKILFGIACIYLVSVIHVSKYLVQMKEVRVKEDQVHQRLKRIETT